MQRQQGLHRRSIRIAGADYTEPGAYFLTICAASRRSIFGRIENGRVVLSALGKIVRACWVQVPNHFPGAAIHDFVVMPNHFHGIVVLGTRPSYEQPSKMEASGVRVSRPRVPRVGARYIVPSDPKPRNPEGFQKPVKRSIPTMVRTFKAAVSREARRRLRFAGSAIWQSNYFERILRDGEEYGKACRYILENPARWEWDRENPEFKNEPSGSV
jgi:putative transposase